LIVICGGAESPSGTSRHFDAAQQFGRFLGEADIIRLAKPAPKPNISTSLLIASRGSTTKC
jgi:hypothetical protein